MHDERATGSHEVRSFFACELELEAADVKDYVLRKLTHFGFFVVLDAFTDDHVEET
jgi:hypothetical protein